MKIIFLVNNNLGKIPFYQIKTIYFTNIIKINSNEDDIHII